MNTLGSVPPAPPSQPGANPLTPEQLAAYAAAVERGKKLRSTVRVAAIDAWLTAFFAACCILCVCSGVENLILGAALAWVAFASFKGLGKLRRFDPQGASDLALNQIVLAAFLTTYFGFALWQISSGKSALVNALVGDGKNSELQGVDMKAAGIDTDAIRDTALNVFKLGYAGMIVGTIAAQGATAAYYRSRRKYFEAYMRDTPTWVIELQTGSKQPQGFPVSPPSLPAKK